MNNSAKLRTGLWQVIHVPPRPLKQGWRPSLLLSTVNRLDSATFGGYAFAVWKHFRRCVSIRHGEKSPRAPFEVTYRQLPFALPAYAIRSTCNCRSPYRQLPFALPAIAVRSAGNCRSPYRQLPFANQSRDFGQLSPFPRLSVSHKRLILGLDCKKKYGDPRKDGLIYSQTEVV